MAANIRLLLVTVLLVPSASLGGDQPDQQGPGRAHPPVARTVLRMARSDDGLEFTDLGRTFATGASAPDLTVLPNGDLLALFDHWIETDGSSQPVMAVSRSRDDGRTWSPMRLLRLRGPDGRRVHGWHGDLVEVADGRYRLYFATGKRPAGSPRPAQAGGRTAILSAVTHNGFEYRLDTRAGVAVSGRADLHPRCGPPARTARQPFSTPFPKTAGSSARGRSPVRCR